MCGRSEPSAHKLELDVDKIFPNLCDSRSLRALLDSLITVMDALYSMFLVLRYIVVRITKLVAKLDSLGSECNNCTAL